MPGSETEALVNLRVRSLLIKEARQRTVTRVFGIPRDDQSRVVTIILVGAAAEALRTLVVRPYPRPRRNDFAVGGAILNEALAHIGGAPSRHMPLAGALIGSAVVARSLRPAAGASAKLARALGHDARTTFRIWSGQAFVGQRTRATSRQRPILRAAETTR